MQSGNLTLADTDRQLLLAHYGFYWGLDSGERSPTTPAQQHFVAVCRGGTSPETDHERAYLDFKVACQNSGIAEEEIVTAGFLFPSAHESDQQQYDSDALDIPVRLCLICRRPIHPERLEAVPSTTRCVACQHSSETSSINPKSSGIECLRCAERGQKSEMVWRIARDPNITGYFLGCSRFPDCRYVDRD
jgi:ssDNA-binding Zn-finger/Zn-ribbon topoisomerase 1